jgi:hypothetical protein
MIAISLKLKMRPKLQSSKVTITTEKKRDTLARMKIYFQDSSKVIDKVRQLGVKNSQFWA